jgi:hypothetical protein
VITVDLHILADAVFAEWRLKAAEHPPESAVEEAQEPKAVFT